MTFPTFYDKWLFWACVFFGLQSFLWVVMGSFDPFGIWDQLAAEAFFGGRTPEAVARFRHFILGPLGATNSAYFFVLALIVRFPFQKRERWSFFAVGGSIWLWFIVDSLASVVQGALFNVALVNLPCVTLISIPLWVLRSRFHSVS